MKKTRKKFRRRIAESLFVGITVTLLISELLAAFLLPSSWVGFSEDLPKMSQAPTYLHDIAPALTSAQMSFPANPATSEPLLHGLNVGMDVINYSYGAGFFDPNFAPWDPSVSDSPSFVSLTRFRFGWPFRALYWDDLSTGTSVAIPAVWDYHLKMYERAGIDRGIGVSYISPGRRLPIAPIWTGLFFNILFWSVAWYVPFMLRRIAIRFRAKRRVRLGLCADCGYTIDEFSMCPECGVEAGVEA